MSVYEPSLVVFYRKYLNTDANAFVIQQPLLGLWVATDRTERACDIVAEALRNIQRKENL